MFILTSIEPANLSISPYPPFGLTTLSFIVLGSYLFLVGFYFSAKSISKDVNVRKSIRQTLHNKNFLEVIANSETESAVLKLVSPLVNKVMEQESDSFYQPSTMEIKDMVKEAIAEIMVEKRKSDATFLINIAYCPRNLYVIWLNTGGAVTARRCFGNF